MARRTALLVLVVTAITAPLAAGHPNPADCTQSALSYDWGTGLNIVHRNGDVFVINARVGNDQIPSGACNITDATITLTFPNPDGSSNGKQFVLATNVDLPADEPKKSFGKRNITVNFDPGVFRGFVTIAVSGVVHGEGHGPDPAPIGSGGRPLVISRPHTTLLVDYEPSTGPPATILYNYSVENDSEQDPAGEISNPTPGVVDATLTDSSCEPLSFTGGDTTVSDPPIVHPGETWTYTCERTLPAGSLVNRVVFTGFSLRDGRPWPSTRQVLAFCGRQEATIVGTEKNDTIRGTEGPDVIVARGGSDTIRSRGGDDIVCGGDGGDVLRGGDGNDQLRGEGAADLLVGGPGTDTLVGGPGADSQQQ